MSYEEKIEELKIKLPEAKPPDNLSSTGSPGAKLLKEKRNIDITSRVGININILFKTYLSISLLSRFL